MFELLLNTTDELNQREKDEEGTQQLSQLKPKQTEHFKLLCPIETLELPSVYKVNGALAKSGWHMFQLPHGAPICCYPRWKPSLPDKQKLHTNRPSEM